MPSVDSNEHLWDTQGGRNISSATAAGMCLQELSCAREEGDSSSNTNCWVGSFQPKLFYDSVML